MTIQRKRARVTFATTGPTRTKQSETAACDVNLIMARFQATGVLEHVNRFSGSFGDFTNTPSDYREALAHVLEGEQAFMALPSAVRKRFGNDPLEFLAFVQDPNNADDLVRLGLATKKPPAPQPPNSGGAGGVPGEAGSASNEA